MQYKIFEWDEIKDKYNESIILGNGSSIAISNTFDYKSLYQKAIELNLINPELSSLFRSFDTNDFEAIMHKLLQAEKVNNTLSINNDPIIKAYNACRDSLIKTIQIIHPEYRDIKLACLDNIAKFLKRFKKVATLNYDLLIYWVMHHGNKAIYDEKGKIVERGSQFKDGFTESSNGGKCFNPDWEYLETPMPTRKSATLIFYIHGSLTLANFIKDKLYELDVKIVSMGTTQLDTIFNKWKSGNYSPLFVCEGEPQRKLAAIKSSNYLSIVYYDVLNKLGSSIVLYGFNFNQQDEHIVSRLGEVSSKHLISNMAVSVYNDGNEGAYMKRIEETIKSKIGKNINVEFYNAESKNCWRN